MENKWKWSMQAIQNEASTAGFDIPDSIPVGHLLFDSHGMIVETDIVTANLLGMTRETLINTPITRVIYCDDQNIFFHHIRSLYETGYFHCLELRMNKQTGTNFHVFLQGAAAPDSLGSHVVHLVFFETYMQKEAQKALRDSNEKKRIVDEDDSDVIWIYNLKQKRYTYFSSSTPQILGFTVEEALEAGMDRLMPSDSSRILYGHLAQTVGHFLVDPKASRRYVNEVEYLCKSGEIIQVEVVTMYQYNSLHEIEVLGLIQPISKEKNQQKRLYRQTCIK